MVDFVGRSRSALDDMAEWGQYFGQADQRAQQRWADAETRRRYDEANRYNRAGAISDSQFMAGNQGVFENMDPMLAGLRPQGVTPATANTATATGTVGTSAATDPAKGSKTTLPAGQPAGLQGSNEPAFDVNQTRPVILGQLSNQQRQAWSTYLSEVRSRSGNPETAQPTVPAAQEQVARSRLNAAGLDIRNGRLVRINPNYSTQALQTPWERVDSSTGQRSWQERPNAGLNVPSVAPGMVQPNAPTVDPGADLAGAPAAAGLTPPTTAATATDPYAQIVGDTSRGLQPTREMRLLDTTIRDNMRRADLAAAHGQREVAQQAFAQALQGQAAYNQQARMVLFRAASAGSLDATAHLLEEFHGYPPGTVQLQPTSERPPRYILQIRNGNGAWTSASEVPRTREEIMGGLLNLIDAEGAAARTEANTHLMEANIRAGADIAVANIQQRTAFMQQYAETLRTQMNNQARAALARGEGRLLVDSTNNQAYFAYSVPDAQGNPIPQVSLVQLQDQPSPDTNGRGRTVQVPVATNVTGIPNVGAN